LAIALSHFAFHLRQPLSCHSQTYCRLATMMTLIAGHIELSWPLLLIIADIIGHYAMPWMPHDIAMPLFSLI
jgi:hypothetical protein